METTLVAELTSKFSTQFDALSAGFLESMTKIVQQAVSDELVKQSRGPLLFTEPTEEQRTKYAPDSVLKAYMLPGEYVVVQYSNGAQCTNYGKFVMYGSSVDNRNVYTKGVVLLTRELQSYLSDAIRYHTKCSNNDDRAEMLREIVDTYNETYGHAHNKIHDHQIAQIRLEARQALASEYAQLEREKRDYAQQRAATFEAAEKKLVERESALRAEKEEHVKNVALFELNELALKSREEDFAREKVAYLATRGSDEEREKNVKHFQAAREYVLEQLAKLDRERAELEEQKRQLCDAVKEAGVRQFLAQR